MERIDSRESMPLLQPEGNQTGRMHAAAQTLRAIGQWILEGLSRLFSCFSCPSDVETASRVTVPEQERVPQIIRFEAFNRGETHPDFYSDRLDVYQGEHTVMGTPLHDLSSRYPFVSMMRPYGTNPIRIRIQSGDNTYERTLPQPKKSGVVVIEEHSPERFTVRIESRENRSQVLHKQRDIQLIGV